MYFDAVLDKNLRPIFNGTPEETKRWLETHPVDKETRVCYGQTMETVTVKQYLADAISPQK